MLLDFLTSFVMLLATLILQIAVLHYFYMFLILAGIYIIVTRKKITLEKELNTHISEKHPEQKTRRANIIRFYVLQMTLSILMCMVLYAGIVRYSYKGIDHVKNVRVVALETEAVLKEVSASAPEILKKYNEWKTSSQDSSMEDWINSERKRNDIK